ncbi:MAG: lysyl-tRNA synthetase, class [Acidimicrobiaceae bacterium]|nr:lysyl-tRNA synthetase, class [Acidimicrobiaceae bacterium]
MSSPIPYRFETTRAAGELASDKAFEDLAPGESSGVVVSVAGRLMRLRAQGRVAFAELRDWTGAIQLFAQSDVTERFDELAGRALGDWVGAVGEVVRTKRGELSVRVVEWVLLAEARRGFGDKWRGVNDPDLRYRQREVDLWANEGVRDTFLVRSKVLAAIRRLLSERGFIEVETPVLHQVASGAHARPFVTHYNSLHSDFYLRIALELHLKRLVVGGFERVFEIGRVFRNEGISPRHNPEFTELELYQAYADYHDVMALTEELVAGVSLEVLGKTTLTYQGRPLDLTPPWRRATLEELVAEQTGVEVGLHLPPEELRRRARELGVAVSDDDGPGKVLVEIYEKTTESSLWGPVFVMDYPKEVSPLARDHRSRPGYVERFEPVIAGRELGNAFSELADPDEQRRRLLDQAAERAAGDEEAMALDEEFLRALEHGMPPTGGLGIGVDRLIMLLTDQANIREVVLFPALRPPSGRGDVAVSASAVGTVGVGGPSEGGLSEEGSGEESAGADSGEELAGEGSAPPATPNEGSRRRD